MQIDLSRFSLYSPDVLLSYWFVSEDFAGLLDLEYSRDAAKRLRELLAGSRAQIDYEADAVTIRFSVGKNVMSALRQLYAGLGWDARELDAIEPQVMSFRRPRPLPLATGDVFVVPLTPEQAGIGQVLDLHFDAPTVSIMRWLGSPQEAKTVLVASLQPLTILHTLGPSLRAGEWPIIGNQPVALNPASGPGKRRGKVGARSYGGDGPVVELLRAFAGLATWEQDYHDPEYLRKLVMDVAAPNSRPALMRWASSMLKMLRQMLWGRPHPRRVDIAFLYTPALGANDVRGLFATLEACGIRLTHLGTSDPPQKWSGSLDEAVSLITGRDTMWNSLFGRDEVRQFDFGLHIHNDIRWDHDEISFSCPREEDLRVVVTNTLRRMRHYVVVLGRSGLGKQQHWELLSVSHDCPARLLQEFTKP